MHPYNIRAFSLDAVEDDFYVIVEFETGVRRGEALSLQHFLDWAGTDSSSALYGRDAATLYDQVVVKAKEGADFSTWLR